MATAATTSSKRIATISRARSIPIYLALEAIKRVENEVTLEIKMIVIWFYQIEIYIS